MPVVEQMIQARQLKIQGMVSQPPLQVKYVTEEDLFTLDPSWRSFFNVNTVAELEEARLLLTRVPPSG